MQALVRYGPEQSGLRALERQAKSTYTTTTRTARGAAQTIIGEVDRARPEVKRNYDKAGLDAARAAHAISEPVLAGLGESANTLKAAAALERSGLQGRLAEGRATALTDLSQRRVQARQGAQFAVSNARSDLVSTLRDVFERQQDLRRERGAFTVATAGQLAEAARDRAQQLAINNADNRSAERRARQQARQQERNSLRTSGIDPNTGKPIKGGVLDPKSPRYKNKGGGSGSGGGPKRATTEKHLEWQTDIESITSYARRYKDMPRSQIVQKLSKGRPQQQVLVDRNGHPLGEGLTPQEKKAAGARKVTLEKIPAFEPNLKMTAALDIALDGHLSRATQKKIHAAGLSLRQMGLPTYGQWKRSRGRVSRPPLARGPSGQQRPT